MAKAAPKTSELNIDLLPKEGPSQTTGSAIHWILTIGRYLIIFTEIVALITFMLGIYLSKQKSDLRDSVKSKQRTIAELQECPTTDLEAFCEDRFIKVQEQINQVAQVKNGQFQTNLVVTEFLSLLPKDMKLDSLIIEDVDVSFSGTFTTEQELQTLITSFNNSQKITALDIVNLTKEGLYKFTATAVINKEEFRTN